MKNLSMKWFALLALSVAGSLAFADGLGLGDPAPALKVAKWVKGKEIKKFEAGKVYVVEFWATWCGPCKESIPHLTELAKKYKGKAEFVGVSVFESEPGDTTYQKTVTDFVAAMGAKMDYNVAYDDPTGIMGKTWMEAANQNGIPAAFVVNQKGQIAWIGHPMGDLDEVLGQVIAGKYDIEAAKKAAQAEKDREERLEKLMKPFQDAIEAGDMQTAIKELDKIVEAEPSLKPALMSVKVQLMFEVDEGGAYKLIDELASGLYKDDAQMLNELAWNIVDPEQDRAKPDYKLAAKVAKRGCELTKWEDCMILDTYALAAYKSGDKDEAIKWQTKAVEFAAKDKRVDEATMKEMKDRLEQFKAGK